MCNNWTVYVSGDVARWAWVALGFLLCTCVAVTAVFLSAIEAKR